MIYASEMLRRLVLSDPWIYRVLAIGACGAKSVALPWQSAAFWVVDVTGYSGT